MLIKLMQARMLKARDQGQNGPHAELALVHRDRLCDRTQHIQGTLVHVGDDAVQVMQLQLVILDDLEQGIGGWMCVATGGVVFE